MAEDAIAKARAIAARLATITASDNLKRKFDGEPGGRKKKKVYIPVEAHPDINFIGLLIGPRGATQKRLEENSGTKILIRGKGASKEHMNEVEDNDDLHVLICGETDEQLAMATKEIEDILFNPEKAMAIKREQLKTVAENNGSNHYGPSTSVGGAGDGGGNETSSSVSEDVEVPRRLVGLIIGRGGETIREIQLKSGAHIQIDREEPGAFQTPTRIVKIGGSEASVEHAKRLIQELFAERTNSSRHYGPGEVTSIEVSKDRIGLVIGRGGSTIRGIQDRTGANVIIPNEYENINLNSNMRKIDIVGTPQVREAARKEISAILNDEDRGGSISIEVPNERVGLIIGRGGENIRSIQDRTGCRIQVPHISEAVGPSVATRTITLSGPPEAVQYAKQEIESIVSEQKTPRDSYKSSKTYSSSSHYGQYDENQYAGRESSQYGIYDQQQYTQQIEATNNAAVDPNDPNAYWNGYYEYAAYYGTEAANQAWGVVTTTETAAAPPPPSTAPAPAIPAAPAVVTETTDPSQDISNTAAITQPPLPTLNSETAKATENLPTSCDNQQPVSPDAP